MIDRIVKDHVFIDFSADYIFGDDEINVTYPARFATVGFQLMSTSLLASLVDRVRKEEGFIPFYPVDEYTESMCDSDGWYEFYIGLNAWNETKVDSCIEAVVCNSHSADEGQCYTIDLSHEEQIAMFNCLDEQCRKHLGKSCDELLTEAEARMKKVWAEDSSCQLMFMDGTVLCDETGENRGGDTQ